MGLTLLEGLDKPVGYRVRADPVGHPFALVTPEDLAWRGGIVRPLRSPGRRIVSGPPWPPTLESCPDHIADVPRAPSSI